MIFNAQYNEDVTAHSYLYINLKILIKKKKLKIFNRYIQKSAIKNIAL